MTKRNDIGFSLVYVSPFEWTIKHDPNVLSVVGSDGMLDDTLGMVLDLTRREDLLRDDVLHECLHAIFRQTPMYKNDEEWAKQEEAIVMALAPRILALLRDNPELVTWLTA